MAKRQSRHDKIEALLKEHLPNAKTTAAVPATHFETQFYRDLVTYRVPTNVGSQERAYAVGRLYIMYRGGAIADTSEECVELRKVLNKVGLQVAQGSGICPEKPATQQALTRQTSL